MRNMIPGSIFAGDLPAGHYGRPSPSATTGCNPDFTWGRTARDGSLIPQCIHLVRLETPEGVYFKRMVFLEPL